MRLAGVSRLLVLALVVGALPGAVSGCDGEDGVGPYIVRVMPDSGASGDAVEIIGERFCGDGSDAATEEGTCVTPPAGFVNFGLDADVVRATISEWTNERITVEIPATAPAGATLVVVTVNGVASNAVDFEIL